MNLPLTIQVQELQASSNEYLRLETIGRKSQQPHQVIVRFITIGKNVIVFPQNVGRQDWVANINTSPKVKVYSEKTIFSADGRVRKITGTDDPILSVFTRKYGAHIVRQRYWGQRTYVELKITWVESGSFDEFIYADLEAAFDGVAEDYDRHIFGNPINTWLRSVSVRALKRYFTPGSVVLEIGCGTGTETLSLARHGVTVLASDISGKMLKVLSKKASQEGLQDRVITIQSRAGELKDRIHALGFEKIDGACSTYGAVNTEPRLNQLFTDLHDLLKDDGTLVLGVWNKFCLYESFGYLLRGRPGLAFARIRNPVPIGRSRFCVKSNAYSVGSLSKHLTPFFKLEKVFGVVILLPPSNLTRYLPKGRLLGSVKKLDLHLGGIFPFNRLGDHFLAVYTSRGSNPQ